jgi:hypothetical protein
VQILAGPPELRTGIFGSMLKLIALTTFVVFPILLLLLLQIQFLPFHDTRITWGQRGALALDIVFLWLLRPPILADFSAESFGRARVLDRILRGFGLVLAGVMSILALWFSIVAATIPGEWQETALAMLDRPGWQITYLEDRKEKTKLVSTHDLLSAGEVNRITRRRDSLFSNTLVLPGFNLYEALKIEDPKKLAWKEHSFDLRARAQLQGASLLGATIAATDFSDSALWHVLWSETELGLIKLEGATWKPLENTESQSQPRLKSLCSPYPHRRRSRSSEGQRKRDGPCVAEGFFRGRAEGPRSRLPLHAR